jgi:hypothetical protein
MFQTVPLTPSTRAAVTLLALHAMGVSGSARWAGFVGSRWLAARRHGSRKALIE